MANFQVPQFIDIEDKIVGPFTMRQFIIVVVTAGLVFILFKVLEVWLWIIVGGAVAALGAAMAFLKINGQNFSKVAINAIRYLFSPRLFVWRRTEVKQRMIIPEERKTPVVEKKVERLSPADLEKIAKDLDK